MDLNLSGRRAIVCGSSQGLGYACAYALSAEGVEVVVNSRNDEKAREAANAISGRTGSRVIALEADVSTEEGRARLVAACPDADILINNAGGPPPGNFRNWSREDWIKALDMNMISAIDMTRRLVDGMSARNFGRVVNITSGAVKAPIGMLGLSNGARAGLTGFMSGLARDVAASGVTVNNLLPGAFDTQRLRGAHEAFARAQGIDSLALREKAAAAIPAGRFGTPDEFGAMCAFLCSPHAGYLTAQNILMDGGAYPGTL